MPAILYVVFSFLLGAGLILGLKPYWENRLQLILKDRLISSSFLFLPAAYLTGTLVLSWITYFLAVIFRSASRPLLPANIISFLVVIVFILTVATKNRTKTKRAIYEIRKYGFPIRFSGTEWFVLIGSAVFWSFFMFRSLYMRGDILHAGHSAFSDFGAHLPVIRSFSAGKNFPAQYPHFPDGTMRYHFMFYFMAGNLEYLGLNLPMALNLPSILSIVSFSMLLYSLAVGITKKPAAGLFTLLFFIFRSSFAFFTFSGKFNSITGFFHAVRYNLDASGERREHIGNTLNESWGLWAQKVYINQRHLAFAFGVIIIVLFLMLPVFIETYEKVINRKKNTGKELDSGKPLSFSSLINNIFFTAEAWMPEYTVSCLIAGILLGLLAFWNGAAVIAAISVLFVMAALSKHKLEFLFTAILTFVLSVIQSKIFVGSGTGAVSIKYKPGFLAGSDNIAVILSFYTELLGILPFVILGAFLPSIARKSKPAAFITSFIFLTAMVILMPSIGILSGIIIVVACTWFFLYIFGKKLERTNISSMLLVPVFTAPILLASTLQLTLDITVNHKYIIFAVILLNIIASDLFSTLIKSGKAAAIALTLCMTLIMISTGIIDMITLYNLDRNSVTYNQNEPLQKWVLSETKTNDIFLTHYQTHYGAPMSIFLSGRMVYNGYPYFTITAGYDITQRERNMKKIYGADDSEQLRELAISEGIRYIVVEEQNRSASEYTLNEQLLYQTFKVVFTDRVKNIVVFSVQ
jgi:hypothetical protein